MAIRLNRVNDTEISIMLDERFDFGSVEQFRKSYEGIGNTRPVHVTVDFSQTRYMDSSALGMLINAKSFLAKSDSKIKIANTNEQIRKIFTISRFDTKFEIS